MPIYEYVCTECNHEIEAIQKISDDALAFCPECSNETLKKKISASAFKLKGTGWYETDFKNTKSNEPNEPNEKGSGDKSAIADGDSSKSDGKTTDGQGKSDSSGKDKASKPSTKQASAA